MYKHRFVFANEALLDVEITVDAIEPALSLEQFDAIWALMEDIHGKLVYNPKGGCPVHLWFRDGVEMGGG